MKATITAVTIFIFSSIAFAGDLILPYSAFGPQAAAHELIGMEWWQWDSHGESKPREYPIKVVVFWNQTREVTAKKCPVDQSKLQDYRYVEYSKAVNHMENLIQEFKTEKLDSSGIKSALAQLKKHKAAQLD